MLKSILFTIHLLVLLDGEKIDFLLRVIYFYYYCLLKMMSNL